MSNTKDEMEMKRKEAEKRIVKMLSDMLGASVEVVKVPKGRTIEEMMTERGYEEVKDSPGEWCEACGEFHPADPEARRAQVESQRLEAVATVEKRIDTAKLLVQRWEEMLALISVPLDDRKPDQIGRELALAAEIDRLNRI